MKKDSQLEEKFTEIRKRKMAQLCYAISLLILFPIGYLVAKGLWTAALPIVLCQIVLFLFAKHIKKSGIYNIGSLIVSLSLATIVCYRSLQGGGLDSSTSIWFATVVGSTFVFLQRKHIFVVIGYVMLLCVYLLGVTLDMAVPLTPELNEPKFLYLFDFACNFGALGYLFMINNSILKEQMNVIKEQENALLLQSRLTSMGEMAASIAHEVNNPLAIILGNVEILEEELDKENQDISMFPSCINAIKRTSNKIRDIVGSLQKLSNGKVDEEMKHVRVSDVYNEVKNLVSKKCEHYGVTPDFEAERNDVAVEGSFTLIGQILLNLISNSLQAIEQLPEKWIKVKCLVESGEVKILVTDSGSGIPKEIEEKVFNSFFTTKDVGKGTGLGLALCKTAAERMGGDITINSEHDNTQFIITLKESKNAEQSKVA